MQESPQAFPVVQTRQQFRLHYHQAKRRRVARGYAWWDEIKSGKATFKEIVNREKLSRRFVAINLDLAFLAPVTVNAIIEGRHAVSIAAQAMRNAQIPTIWGDPEILGLLRRVAFARLYQARTTPSEQGDFAAALAA